MLSSLENLQSSTYSKIYNRAHILQDVNITQYEGQLFHEDA